MGEGSREMISGHSRGLCGSLFVCRLARDPDCLGHVQFVTFVITPTGLVDPETARNAQHAKSHVGRKEFVAGAYEQAKQQEQAANQHPVLGNSPVDTIG